MCRSSIMCLLVFWLGHLLLLIEFVYLTCYISTYHFLTHGLILYDSSKYKKFFSMCDSCFSTAIVFSLLVYFYPILWRKGYFGMTVFSVMVHFKAFHLVGLLAVSGRIWCSAYDAMLWHLHCFQHFVSKTISQHIYWNGLQIRNRFAFSTVSY